jgi:hypothetical protein
MKGRWRDEALETTLMKIAESVQKAEAAERRPVPAVLAAAAAASSGNAAAPDGYPLAASYILKTEKGALQLLAVETPRHRHQSAKGRASTRQRRGTSREHASEHRKL